MVLSGTQQIALSACTFRYDSNLRPLAGPAMAEAPLSACTAISAAVRLPNYTLCLVKIACILISQLLVIASYGATCEVFILPLILGHMGRRMHTYIDFNLVIKARIRSRAEVLAKTTYSMSIINAINYRFILPVYRRDINQISRID